MSEVKSLKVLLLRHDLAFIFLVLVMAVIGLIGSYYWSSYTQESQRIASLQDAAQQINAMLYRQIKEVTHGSSMQDPNTRKKNEKRLIEVQAKFKRLNAKAQLRSEKQAIASLETIYQQIEVDISRLFEVSPIKREAQRIKLLSADYQGGTTAAFDKTLARLAGLIETRRINIHQQLNEQLNVLVAIMPLPILAAILFVFLSRRALKLNVLEPVARLNHGAERLSTGNLGIRIAETGVEEMRILSSTMNAMAQDLEQSHQRLLENERQAALGSLVPVVAHNIRNPLAGIRATMQLMDEDVTQAEIQESKTEIIATVDRLERWVSALLRYLNPLRQVRTSMPLVKVLEEVVLAVQHLMEEKNIRVEKIGWSQTISVSLDPDLMEQALHGLVLNAIEASPESSQIRLTLEQHNNEVVLVLEDQGPGISFTPDPKNLTPGPTTKKMGTGLGLPFAYKVIRAHGWDISFVSTNEKGTRVRIQVPLA